MRILIKRKHDFGYLDITKYVNLPISMTRTEDGTFNEFNFTLFLPNRVGFIDGTKPIEPKLDIKFSEVDNVIDEIEGVNTFYFITSDNNNMRRRKAFESDEYSYDALWEHNVNSLDIIHNLDDKYLPNYTIRQPKTEYFSNYTKNAGVQYTLNQKVTQDGSELVLFKGYDRELASSNNNNNITFGYDETLKEHYVEFNELDQVGLDLNLSLAFAKTANTIAKYKFLGLNFTTPVGVFKTTTERLEISKYILETKTYYFVDNFNYNSYNTSQLRDIKYNGGEVRASGIFLPDGSTLLNSVDSLGAVLENNTNLIIPKNNNYNSCRVYFNLKNTLMEEMSHGKRMASIPLSSNIAGYTNDTYVKSEIHDMTIKAGTSLYVDALEEKKTTLLEFVEKAIFDYNFNSRKKVKLDDEVKVLLDVTAKEGEWSSYTLRELLVRAFKYVNLRPVLKNDYTITYSKTTRISRYIDFGDVNGVQTEQISDDFYDKVVSSSKNLVSQDDFITEILPLSSTSLEFSHIDEKSGGFLTSNNIYYVSNGILYTPDFELIYGEEVVKTNMGKDYYWDITSMLYESDIYSSFPNVSLKGNIKNDELSTRADINLLTQANRLSYKSGSNIVTGLFNIGGQIPDYNFASLIGYSTPEIPEYAVIEMLITLGYQTLSDPIGKDVSIPNKHLVDIQRYQLHLTYVPIFDEVTTKYTSNMGNRKGLNWEKKLNINDKLVSYKDNESILRNEMERKGNVKLAFNETHSNIASAIPVNSIINDNLYITTCNYFIRNNVVEVEYVVQENFILQNEDIRLPVSFERYNIPYEYVKREVYLENYLIFSKYQNFKYTNEIKSSNLDFIKYNLFSKNIDNNDKINKIMYGLVDIDNRSYLMRMAWVKSRFTMMIHGKFLDNYVAGIQRYSGIDDDPINRRLYSTPLSYTNGNGKFNSINSFQLGYNTSKELRLALENGDDYNLNLFPFGIIDGSKVNFNVNLINYQETIAINKDAGEQVSITLSNYLQNENEELKFYEFLEINKIGILNEDIFLNDDLLLSDINYSDYEYSFDYVVEEFAYNSFRVKITDVDVSEFDKGIVLLNETNNVTSLVGIVKTPTVVENYLEFYIYTSRNGFYQRDTLEVSMRVEIEANHSKFKDKAYTLDMSMGVDIATNHRNFKYDAYKLDMSMGVGIDLAAIHGKVKYNTYTPDMSMSVEIEANHSKFKNKAYTLDIPMVLGVEIATIYGKFKHNTYTPGVSMGVEIAASHSKIEYDVYTIDTLDMAMGVEMTANHSRFEYDVYTLDTLEVSMGVDIDFNYKKQ